MLLVFHHRLSNEYSHSELTGNVIQDKLTHYLISSGHLLLSLHSRDAHQLSVTDCWWHNCSVMPPTVNQDSYTHKQEKFGGSPAESVSSTSPPFEARSGYGQWERSRMKAHLLI